MIERSPYTLFMLLGDVGGLQDGLILLVRYFISFFATFALKNELINYAEKNNLIKLRGSEGIAQTKVSGQDSKSKDVVKNSSIASRSWKMYT